MNDLIKNNINQETVSNSLIDSTKLSLLSKLYIWSLIFEPLLFFSLASGGQATGITLSISRLIQILVVLIFLFRMVRIRKNKLQFYFILPFTPEMMDVNIKYTCFHSCPSYQVLLLEYFPFLFQHQK